MIFARAADASDDNDLFASASERVTDGEMSVGVVLFDGQNYLFAVVKLSFGVRVEVPDNDRRTDAETLGDFQADVGTDDQIVDFYLNGKGRTIRPDKNYGSHLFSHAFSSPISP